MTADRAPTLADLLRERFHEVRAESLVELGFDVLVLAPDGLVEAMTWLRDEQSFGFLMDVCAIDWHPRDPRYDVNYQLYDHEADRRLRVKVQIPDADPPHMPSVTGLWPTANWHERETFDMFGVVFDGHPDLTRILMPDEWIGHPLRKDYPVGGVPVEYKIEPAYIGERVVSEDGRPAAGGVPARLLLDRGRRSHWTWTGAPASGVRGAERPDEPGSSEAGDAT